jgi:hypothetical protein
MSEDHENIHVKDTERIELENSLINRIFLLKDTEIEAFIIRFQCL